MAAPQSKAVKDSGGERMRKAVPLVEELGAIEKEIAAVGAELAKKLGTKPGRADQLRAEILALYTDAPAEIPFVVDGARFVGTLTGRTNQTRVTSMEKIHKFLGKAKVLALSTIALGVLRKELTPEQLAACTKTERTGARSLSVLEKGEA